MAAFSRLYNIKGDIFIDMYRMLYQSRKLLFVNDDSGEIVFSNEFIFSDTPGFFQCVREMKMKLQVAGIL